MGFVAMRLYHTTGVNGLLGILESQCIAVSARDQVVWLTDHKEGWIRRQASSKGAEATAARITVELPEDEIIPWGAWKGILPWGAQEGLEYSARRWGYGEP